MFHDRGSWPAHLVADGAIPQQYSYHTDNCRGGVFFRKHLTDLTRLSICCPAGVPIKSRAAIAFSRLGIRSQLFVVLVRRWRGGAGSVKLLPA